MVNKLPTVWVTKVKSIKVFHLTVETRNFLSVLRISVSCYKIDLNVSEARFVFDLNKLVIQKATYECFLNLLAQSWAPHTNKE